MIPTHSLIPVRFSIVTTLFLALTSLIGCGDGNLQTKLQGDWKLADQQACGRSVVLPASFPTATMRFGAQTTTDVLTSGSCSKTSVSPITYGDSMITVTDGGSQCSTEGCNLGLEDACESEAPDGETYQFTVKVADDGRTFSLAKPFDCNQDGHNESSIILIFTKQ